MKHWILAFVAPLALAAQPAIAQITEEEADFIAAFQETLTVEPLTAEQEARLPLAEAIVTKMLPEGALQEMMRATFDRFLGPITDMEYRVGPDLADYIGYDESEVDLTDEQIAEIAAIIDPQWKERKIRAFTLVQEAMSDVMTVMEPAIRMGMIEAYAANFSMTELTDINAFFSTKSGLAFARKYYDMTNDPHVMSAVMSSLPSMMELAAQMEERMRSAMADLPERRTFDTLTPDQKAYILTLTGLDEEDLQIGMNVAAEINAEEGAF